MQGEWVGEMTCFLEHGCGTNEWLVQQENKPPDAHTSDCNTITPRPTIMFIIRLLSLSSEHNTNNAIDHTTVYVHNHLVQTSKWYTIMLHTVKMIWLGEIFLLLSLS